MSKYIQEEESQAKTRDVALFAASENMKSIMNTSQSMIRGRSVDNKLNNSLCMSDGGYLFRTNNEDASTLSVLNEMRSIPTIYANRSVAGLGGMLQFGYSHKYNERKHYKEIIKPIIKANTSFSRTGYQGSVRALSLSLNDADTSSFFQVKTLTPMKSKQGKRTHRMFINRLAQQQEEKLNMNYTQSQLDEIRKIHKNYASLH